MQRVLFEYGRDKHKDTRALSLEIGFEILTGSFFEMASQTVRLGSPNESISFTMGSANFLDTSVKEARCDRRELIY